MASYSTHVDYMRKVAAAAATRKKDVEKAIHAAFGQFIDQRTVDVIVFSGMSVHQLAGALQAQPLVLKPLLACCNIAARAIERDLEIKNVDTYVPSLTATQAAAIAGYMKPFLPDVLEVPALSSIDAIYFIDKEIRKGKGQWEKRITEALSQAGKVTFKKRKFELDGEAFEIDAATPTTGKIEIGVDIKRIEARRDIHKRSDEIVNKARAFREAYPDSQFAAVIYYPFIDEHVNVQSRLRAPQIDAVVFASDGEESIESAAKHLLASLKNKGAK